MPSKRKVISGALTPKRMRGIIHSDAIKRKISEESARKKKARELKKNDPDQLGFKF